MTLPFQNWKQGRVSLLICLVLALGTAALYWPITNHPFILYDDEQYITTNQHVTTGLSGANFIWAFTSREAANWHPLTWLSHQADCTLFGLKAGGHHLVNLLFHVANTLLIFAFLRGATGATWRSALVAALFAWHPLHVESVAWASERKDVLSTFFWLLTLLAYVRYAQDRRLNSQSSARTYFLALFFFACGLMSKPMVVTLPFVLLLLDFWPLQRLQTSDFRSFFRLIAEKTPFFALSAAGSAMTYLAQKTGGAFWTLTALPLHERAENALVAYGRYVFKTFWPADLAIVYPHPRHWPAIVIFGSMLMLVAWTGLFLWRARRNPYLAVGWFWFLGTLIPTIGLVQVGSQSMADRYIYIPSIGLFIVIVWGLNELCDRWPERKKFLLLAGGVALITCLGLASIQLTYWQSGTKLFFHAVEVTADNYVACNCLGKELENSGQKHEACVVFAKSVRIETNFPPAQINLALSLAADGRTEEAITHFEAALRLTPHDSELQYHVGTFLLQHDRPDEAISHLAATIAERPAYAEAHNALGWAWLRQSKPDQAVPQFLEAVKLNPDFAAAHFNLAFTLNQLGKTNEALPRFAKAVSLQSTNAEYRRYFGLALLDNHQPNEAAIQFAEELKLTPDEPKAHLRLAQALQQQGNFAEAVLHYQAALNLTPDFPEAQAALDRIFSTHPDLKPANRSTPPADSGKLPP